MIDILVDKFDSLTDAQKHSFLKKLMPSVGELFRRDPQRMMQEMMPMCEEMMKGCDQDMRKMMKLMEANAEQNK